MWELHQKSSNTARHMVLTNLLSIYGFICNKKIKNESRAQELYFDIKMIMQNMRFSLEKYVTRYLLEKWKFINEQRTKPLTLSIHISLSDGKFSTWAMLFLV